MARTTFYLPEPSAVARAAAPLPPSPPATASVAATELALDERIEAVRARKKRILENLARIEKEAALLDAANVAHERFVAAVDYFGGLGDYVTQRAGAAVLVLDAQRGVEKAVRNLDAFLSTKRL